MKLQIVVIDAPHFFAAIEIDADTKHITRWAPILSRHVRNRTLPDVLQWAKRNGYRAYVLEK